MPRKVSPDGGHPEQDVPRRAISVRIAGAREPSRWQTIHDSEEAARDECERRARLEGVRMYLRHVRHKDGSQYWSAIEEEVFLMCGGRRAGMGKVIEEFSPDNERR